jgi:hypothetical protein
MRIGCIFVAWQCADLLSSSVTPWIEAKRARLGGHDFSLCAVSVPFEGFPQPEMLDETRVMLDGHAQHGEIDHVVVGDKPHKETEARGAALRWLMTQGVDVTILVDADEFWTAEQIEAAFTFVAANPWIGWFRVCYKQLVFTRNQWLKEPFTPPRIHRLKVGRFRADSFWDDNNVLYYFDNGPPTTWVKDIDMSSLTVPQSQVWVKHDTWTNSPRSRAKVAYQNSRPGWLCDFAWDDARGGLVWRDGLTPPEVVTA